VDGLDLLGAADALADQYITFRIRRIDREKLRNKVGGSKGTLASSAMSFVDVAPKAALDAAIPLVVGQAKGYGVELEAGVSNVPPSKGGRAISEFWPALAIGLGLGGGSLVIWKSIARLFGR